MRTLGWAALLVLGFGAALAVGQGLWNRSAEELGKKLDAGKRKSPTAVFRPEALAGLPDPVQRYLRTVLPGGRPVVTGARILHRGMFNMSETGEKWKPFTSRQKVVTARPGFDWEARIRLAPGVFVLVRDAYAGGEGVLKASLWGLFTVAKWPASDELAFGELMRFLAESPWYPTVLLPSPFLKWEPVDGSHARATLTDGRTSVTLEFVFGPDGLVEKVRAKSRPRTAGKRTEDCPWEGRFWKYERHQGMLIPTEGEVSWILPGGTLPYWRGRIEGVEYSFEDGSAP